MLRKIAIITNLLAMMMVLFTTVVPHHHHRVMVCLVKEVCVMDGCCNDEHTMHSDADHGKSENHCIACEKFFPSDNVRLDGFTPVTAPVVLAPAPVLAVAPTFHISCRRDLHSSHPPLLTWKINC